MVLRRALVACFAILFSAPAWADFPDPLPDEERVQPGAAVFNMRTTDHGHETHREHCTLNYVFDGAGGGTYIGSAGHCFDEDNQYRVIIGDPVYRRDDSVLGTLKYRVHDDPAVPLMDFMLIRVADAQLTNVRSWVYGHPDAPSGVAAWGSLPTRDLVRIVGYIGDDAIQGTPLHDDREGILTRFNETGYCADIVAFQGDSGAPVFHKNTTLALGVLKGRDLADCQAPAFGPTVEAIIAHLANVTYPVTMRTA